ncbi:MAG: tRNA 2-thiouridine synthesizing protein A [Candidatus Azotimanducaceae bacterium]|jgi:tRNA 2-thiouridine synthesizing protein A
MDIDPNKIEVALEVDASGLRCPEPLMLVRNKIMDMQSGQVIKVTATDPSTSWDFPNFCKFLKHEMVHSYTDEAPYLYWIKKK